MASSEQRITEVAEYAYKLGVYEAADRYMLSVDSVKRYMRDYNSRNESDTQYSMEQKLNQAEVEIKTDKKVTNLEKFIKDSGIDLDVWKVDSYKASSWDAQTKDGIKKLTSVKANVTKKVLDQCEWEPLKAVDVPVIKRKETKGELTNQILILSDMHFGFERHGNELVHYHDRRIIDAILQMLRSWKFKTIIFNGDMLDLAEAGKYTSKPEYVQMTQPALNEFAWFLSEVRRLAPYSEIVYTGGNHESRLERGMLENFSWAYGLKAVGDTHPLVSIPNMLKLDNLDIEWKGVYPNSEYWITDKLRVYHGEYTSNTKELSTTDSSVIFGHVHSDSVVTKTMHTRQGPKTIEVHTSGTLAKIDGTLPGVRSKPDWNQGFITVDVIGDDFNVNHHMFRDGKLIYKDVLYVGQEYEYPV